MGGRSIESTVWAGGLSPTPEPGTATEGAVSRLLGAGDLLWFGVGALVIFGVVFVIARTIKPATTKPAAYVTFARLFSLLTVAVLATLLAFATVADEARTAAFAVLGTIAGFLAGAKGTTTTTEQAGAGPGAGTTLTTESTL